MHWDLLDRYVTDSCNSGERDEVERWLAESAGRRRVLEQIAEALEEDSPEALKTVRNQLVQELGLERDVVDSAYKPKRRAKERGKKGLGRGVKETVGRAKKKVKSPKPTTRSAKPKPKKPGGGGKKPR